MRQVLRGATVVDGTGSPRRQADVEIVDGAIGAIGTIARDREAIDVDLDGLVLAPGFIDIHTHYDAQVFWDPDFTPSCWHGVTTAIQGNCGFGIDWCFETFPEYLDAVTALPKRINLGAFIGHSAVRIYAMGGLAAFERAATADEIAHMCHLIHEAMAAGAMGFSTSQAPTHVGARGLPVPSRVAEPDELRQLLGAVAETDRGIVEITYGPQFEIEEIAALSKELGLRITWGSLLTNLFGPRGAAMDLLERASAVGGDIWPQVSSRFITLLIQLNESMLFFQPVPVWQAAIGATRAEREAMYRDPAWRDRARAQVHATDIPGWKPERWERIWVDETVKHADLRGRRLHELAAERGADPMDVMLDLALDENLETRFRVATTNADPVELRQLLTDDRTVLGAHDAGAHVDVLCDAGYPSWVLGHWVREEQAMSLEHAIYKLAGQPAEVFRLHDRGRIATGLAADLVAFDADTVAALPNERVWDFPANGDRLISRNVGTHHVWVNGKPIRHDGEDVPQATPGRTLAPNFRPA